MLVSRASNSTMQLALGKSPTIKLSGRIRKVCERCTAKEGRRRQKKNIDNIDENTIKLTHLSKKTIKLGNLENFW
jgi:hypothetical protein